VKDKMDQNSDRKMRKHGSEHKETIEEFHAPSVEAATPPSDHENYNERKKSEHSNEIQREDGLLDLEYDFSDGGDDDDDDDDLMERKRLALSAPVDSDEDTPVDEETQTSSSDVNFIERKRLAMAPSIVDNGRSTTSEPKRTKNKRLAMAPSFHRRQPNSHTKKSLAYARPSYDTNSVEESKDATAAPDATSLRRQRYPGAYRMSGSQIVMRTEDDDLSQSRNEEGSSATKNEDDPINATLVEDATVEPIQSPSSLEMGASDNDASPVLVTAEKIQKKPWYKVRRIQVVIFIALIVVVGVVIGVVFGVQALQKRGPPPPRSHNNNNDRNDSNRSLELGVASQPPISGSRSPMRPPPPPPGRTEPSMDHSPPKSHTIVHRGDHHLRGRRRGRRTR